MFDTFFLEPPNLTGTDALPVRTATPDMIDLDKVRAHIAQAIERGRYRGTTTPHDYLLEHKCLVAVESNLYATLAGVLCFGRNPQALFPRAVVDIGHYRGTESISFELVHLEKDIGGTLFDQLARVEAYLWTNTHHGMTLNEGFQRVEVHEYPLAVIRELCINMLAHRDYANFLSAARVQLFRNRIEWINPGGLLPGITLENILVEQASRNPHIQLILYEAGYVEAFGQGLDTVMRVLDDEDLPLPRFQETGNSFIVTVYGRPLNLVADARIYANLNKSQRKILSLLRSKGMVTPSEIRELLEARAERSIQRDLKGLLEAGLIEALGNARAVHYILRRNAC